MPFFLCSCCCSLQGLFLSILLLFNLITYPKSLFKMSHVIYAYCVPVSSVRRDDFPAFHGCAPLSEVVCINLLWSLHLSSSCNSCPGSLLSSIFSAWTIPIHCYDKYHFKPLINTKCAKHSVKGQDVFLFVIYLGGMML